MFGVSHQLFRFSHLNPCLVNILLCPPLRSAQDRVVPPDQHIQFLLILVGAARSPSGNSIEKSRGYHRVINSPKRTAHAQSPQKVQKVEVTLALLIQVISVVGPVQFNFEVNIQVLETVNVSVWATILNLMRSIIYLQILQESFSQ